MDSVASMMTALGLTQDDIRRMQQAPSFGDFSARSARTRPPQLDPNLPAEELRRRMVDMKAWLDEEHTLGPMKAPRMSREILISSHLAACRAHDLNRDDQRDMFRSTIVGFDKHSSVTSLEQLARISLSEMLVRKVHKGRYLLCRSITPSGIQMLIEDPDGNAQDLSIYNFPTAGSSSSPDIIGSLFPVGVVMALREPTFKTATQGPYPIIRIDSPSDVVFIDPQSKLLRGVKWKTGLRVDGSTARPLTADGWKDVGNRHFKAKRLLAAAIAYCTGISLDPSAYLLRLNRAEAFLRLEYYSAALLDAEHVLALPNIADTCKMKALFRAARADYGRGNYVSAEKRFTEWLSLHPEDADCMSWVHRSQLRLKESRTGEYNWLRMLKESELWPHVDAASYRGPIEVKALQDRGGGRGIVASRPIAVGEILIVEKPFVSVFPQDLPSNEHLLSFNLITKILDTPSQTAVMSGAIERIYGNPDLHDSVFDLYGGPDYKQPPSYPPGPNESLHISNLFPLTSAVDIDTARLEAICAYNIFTPNVISTVRRSGSATQSAHTPQDEDRPSALYLLSSLFNHACASNAHWFSIGDVMVIRAAQSMTKDEEITLPYTPGSGLYEKRQDALLKHMLSGCDCPLCKDDRRDGNKARKLRDKLDSQFMDIIEQRRTLPVQRFRTLVKKLEGTYPRSRSSFRPSMYGIYHTFAEVLRIRVDENPVSYLREAIESEFKALASVGVQVLDKTIQGALPQNVALLPVATDRIPSTIFQDHTLLTMVSIAYSFAFLEDRQRVERWIKAAGWVNEVVFGGNKVLFLYRFGDFLEDINLRYVAEQVL